MRSLVYNRYWSTAGGAEAYAGAVAQLLSAHGPVELLAHEDVDRDALSERLGLDLSGCTVTVVPQASAAITAATRGADLLVNVSHRSREATAARRSLYVVHFPTALGDPAPPATGLPRVEWGTGVHGTEGRTTWTDGAATLLVTTEPGRPVDVTVLVGASRPPAAGATDVRLVVDGRERAGTRLDRAPSPLDRWSGRPLTARVTSPAAGVAVEVRVESGSFVPAELLGTADTRTLGVPVVGVVLGSSLRARATRAPAPVPTGMSWIDGYDRVVANSAFTQGWVRRLWQRESTVLHPPVSLRRGGPKEQVVLAVGRFFPTGQGHSKKQLELVRAFRTLVDGGLTGWTLHLVGGCSDSGRAYLEQVRAEAAGYPVELTVGASGAALDALYARASVFWHAAGLDEDPETHPDRLEHFGISTVEAMSAGVVPVVLARGGLVETVRDGVDGLHVHELDGYARRTRELLDDPARLRALSVAASARAQDFSLPAFDARLQSVLVEIGL